jgi:DNA repair exonuclease SbcCD ATPase subunit
METKKTSKEIFPLEERFIHPIDYYNWKIVTPKLQKCVGALESAESELSTIKQENERLVRWHKNQRDTIGEIQEREEDLQRYNSKLFAENESLKKEVKEFAEWCSKEEWEYHPIYKYWQKTSPFYTETKTTEELYNLYKSK